MREPRAKIPEQLNIISTYLPSRELQIFQNEESLVLRIISKETPSEVLAFALTEKEAKKLKGRIDKYLREMK